MQREGKKLRFLALPSSRICLVWKSHTDVCEYANMLICLTKTVLNSCNIHQLTLEKLVLTNQKPINKKAKHFLILPCKRTTKTHDSSPLQIAISPEGTLLPFHPSSGHQHSTEPCTKPGHTTGQNMSCSGTQFRIGSHTQALRLWLRS